MSFNVTMKVEEFLSKERMQQIGRVKVMHVMNFNVIMIVENSQLRKERMQQYGKIKVMDVMNINVLIVVQFIGSYAITPAK